MRRNGNGIGNTKTNKVTKQNSKLIMDTLISLNPQGAFTVQYLNNITEHTVFLFIKMWS